jgi:hypothetical protein
MTSNHMRTSWAFLSALCTAVAGCGDLYVMNEMVETTDGKREAAGAGCSVAFSRGGPTLGGGLADAERDFEFVAQERDGKYEVTYTSQGMLLARRAYSERFLLSGKRDTFEVTTVSGRSFELTYWGGDECEAPRD